jgi:NhaA family Na+:H+ antiporter
MNGDAGRLSDRVRRATDPVSRFIRDEEAGGAVLVVAALAALAWANSPAGSGYVSFWERDLAIGVGDAAISDDLRHWVNDALMALFFFVVGLEIKRELVVGELRDRRAATLPIMAAAGGVVLPALVFVSVTGTGAGSEGWAVPAATDIAFAVGVLALLGDRVSAGLKLSF